MKAVLAISPHPDDVEFGCGATIAALVDAGVTVYHALVTAAENIGEKKVDRVERWIEFKDANAVLGVFNLIRPADFFEHRKLPGQRQELLQWFVDINSRIRPDTVFVPCVEDIHQDHSAVAVEALRAFKGCDILGYDILWNNISFNSQAFFKITTQAISRKIKAIQCYKSQSDRHYFDDDLVMSAARMRGAQAGVKFAESFSNVRRFINWER